MPFLSTLSENPQFTVLTTVIAGGALVLWFLTRTWSSSKPWLPSADVGLFETVKEVSGTRSPFFLLELARKMKSNTFRVPLPIVRNGTYIVNDAKLAREILNDPTTGKPHLLYKHFAGITGRQIMFTNDDTPYMRALRRGTAHAFSKDEVGRMNDIARKHVDAFLGGRLADKAERGESFDPGYEMNRITFSVICEAAMEYTNTVEEYETYFYHIQIAVKEFTFRQATNPLRGVLWTLLPRVREALASSKICMDFIHKMLESYQNSPVKSKHNTLIKQIDENPACGNDNMLKTAELLSWVIAGHDSTGYSLSNLLVLLSKHQDVQDKLRKAIEGVADPTQVDYYQYVIKEANRLVPAAAMGAGRSVGRDYDVGDYIIPSGAIVFLTQYIGNHDERIFPDPESFKPERWENTTKEMTDQIYQFSLGERNCPGQALAVSEINSTLSRLISEYQFVLEEPGELEFFFTLKYTNARIKAIKL